MAVAIPSKPKKKSQVNPVATEMDELGAPPSTSDFGELFQTSDNGPQSSMVAFTEDTALDDSRRNIQDIDKDAEESSSSRSSTPSSAAALNRRKNKNAVVPIQEETSFSDQNLKAIGKDNPTYESDTNIPRSSEAWSDSGSVIGNRPNTVPSSAEPFDDESLQRPQTAPSSSPNIFQIRGKVTPLSSATSLQKDPKNSDDQTKVEDFKFESDLNPVENDDMKSEMKDMTSIEQHSESDHEEKTDIPEKSAETQLQIIEEAILAPPQSSGEHQAYVPMDYAKECIQRVIEDMKKMKANHFEVVEKIQQQYQFIEEESQAQFNEYVIKLRGEYSAKVSTIRHVLESHQTDAKQKQEFYEQAIKSLRDKNRSLLIEKRNYLLKSKDQNVKNEQEKNQILLDLTNMLDQKHKEYVSLRQRFVDERTHNDKIEKENSELRNQLNELNSKLTFAFGESNNLVDELNQSKVHNEQLSKTNQQLQEDHTVKDDVISANIKLLEEKDNTIEHLQKQLHELSEQIKQLENRPPQTVDVQAEVIQQSAEIPAIDHEQLDSLRKQIEEKENTIEELKSESEEKEKDWKSMHDKLFAEMKELSEEKNVLKLGLIGCEEKNSILHKRLETMLNEVMGSVDNDQILVKLNELKERKTILDERLLTKEEEIERWKQAFVEENEREPTEEERPEEIQSAYDEVKNVKEELMTVEKDITVLSMLIDGTLPDDMKQQGEQSTSDEELKRQFEVEKAEIRHEVEVFKKQISDQEKQIEELKENIKELEEREPEKIQVETYTAVHGEDNSELLSEVREELSQALQKNEEQEKEHNDEMDAQKKHAHKVEKKLSKLQSAHEGLEAQKREVESQLKILKESNEAELKLKQEKVEQLQKEIDELNEEKLSKLPVKAKTEIKALQEKLKQLESEQDGSSEHLLELNTKNTELSEQIANMEITISKLKEKEVELQKMQEVDKKYKELKKKYKALEAKKTVTKSVAAPATSNPDETKKLQKKIAELEKKLQSSEDASPRKDTKESKVDPKALNKLEKSNEMLKEKVESLKNSAKVDADKIKELQEKLKEAKAKGDDKNAKKQEKAMKDLQKKLEAEEKKAAKHKENLEKAKEEIAELNKELDALKAESKKDKDEITKLGVAAKEGLEAMEKVDELKKSNKSLSEENKTLAENFNSERILRKKYYNIVEDMKGKIRVYARARPLSRSELDRGNHSIISSPDEYSLIINTQRGPKDFQYDAVFTPDHNQEKVFEDTNNLIQSAVDGYNVCIFAYGQTGSGKTFTMIGDKEQKFPGIAPRSFKAIYELIDENKTKFSFKTSMYMMELYRDNLIDLFGNTKNPEKLDIKKDKKGMVVVIGSVVKEASSSEELMSLFEVGSASRHVASTKMNSESSRSHLVLSIVIESTNLTSGAVTKGKLSLVDLAGSERAAKTGATAEQLKEAQSINKSLSALGDVISALSSEQSFIPYRNNKLTMLMQDSLGGNAKTLMFVNISPADYNADETVTSLTYASRVKLITNDASKNADNKEISRLKGIIAKLKKGESIDAEDDV